MALGSAAAATGSSNVSPGGGDSSAWSHAADRVNAVLSTARQHFSLSTGVPFIPNLHQPVGRCMPNTTGSNPGTSAAIAAAYEQQQKAPSAANMAELSSAMTAAQNLAGGSSLLGGGHLGGGGSTQSPPQHISRRGISSITVRYQNPMRRRRRSNGRPNCSISRGRSAL